MHSNHDDSDSQEVNHKKIVSISLTAALPHFWTVPTDHGIVRSLQ
jgi:hypothetical protein